MTPETIFTACNSIALLGWILLILLPKKRWIAGFLLPIVGCGSLALIYCYLMIRYAGSADGGFTSLDDVESLFRNRNVLLAGWLHYLVFDLFIGCWQVRDAQRLGIAHRWIVPALLLTFVAGPIGLLTYYLIRVYVTRTIGLDEDRPRDLPASSAKISDATSS